MAPEYVSEPEVQRRIREALNRASDERIGDMADRDGERLAVVETELRHARNEQEKMMTAITSLRNDVQDLKSVLTKASGMKLAFMVFIGGIGFLLSQFWSYIGWAKP